jgi:hypothetical protein
VTFKTNANKDYLRSSVDRGIVSAWRARRGTDLRYLGLPGPDMLDIIDWQEYLESFTTIERSENEQHRIFLKANVRDVEHRLHSLYGEFDSILVTGRDSYGQAPRWPYDIVNLDFYGGLLYSNLARPKALAKLVANQDTFGRGFVLFVTHDVRDMDAGGEKRAFLQDVRKLLLRERCPSAAADKAVDWYLSEAAPDVARQALYLNMLLRDLGEANHFEVRLRPAVAYLGTGGTKMVHHAAEFDHQAAAYRAVSEQSATEVFNLGYRELDSGKLLEPAFARVRAST